MRIRLGYCRQGMHAGRLAVPLQSGVEAAGPELMPRKGCCPEYASDGVFVACKHRSAGEGQAHCRKQLESLHG